MANITTTDETAWQQVLSRDADAEGAFVYAVTSTGIYCRPTCPSRRPKRENVRFFGVPEAAEQAGFRACKRCRPEIAEAQDPRLVAIRQACRQIEQADTVPGLEALAGQAGLSPFHFQRLFAQIVGVSPKRYAEARRQSRLRHQLRKGEAIGSALYGAGYGSSSRLYEKAGEYLGMTPATYKKGGDGMAIRYALAETPLGLLCVAATERGLCAVSLADDPAEALADLAAEFPRAVKTPDQEGLGALLAVILEHVAGTRPHIDLPLDIRATAFQHQVWEQLRQIPRGETRSYTDIAEALGNPQAVRAVARACATNPVAIVIPCHRVVRQDGALAGYRWGLERKRALLKAEQKAE
ncbi:MAG: bifunctional DNA-binding transcriptional regulator/O6-methylguanine-DNA methyltransferase Ada [Alphaproteobacteria bacterium]|nr:bifunctional DNA-binding transcriptional regulator/O6-methylguanine-DNA methyltransferase Ada [Alphaproteobacteria bacterium]MBU0798323.1 bifunctional DNA-binding transcriptional regulator/O6-methylguanine-DNA methyltransferase Ada [Alphaproteobacteria bacterium]MBU0887424.1 bifunctional DNA-binding transcriptional regulator/O6-methylguanine-DNA methyltransferase Ada [Alphaproteobacteria bacterium]MBU1813367.1 bifunctional DNA-binding transcriptional regulator/O6-methylguanine-DNA methyltrans